MVKSCRSLGYIEICSLYHSNISFLIPPYSFKCKASILKINPEVFLGRRENLLKKKKKIIWSIGAWSKAPFSSGRL